MKETTRTRPLTLDRPPPLNSLRNVSVAVVIGIAFAAMIWYAIG